MRSPVYIYVWPYWPLSHPIVCSTIVCSWCTGSRLLLSKKIDFQGEIKAIYGTSHLSSFTQYNQYRWIGTMSAKIYSPYCPTCFIEIYFCYHESAHYSYSFLIYGCINSQVLLHIIYSQSGLFFCFDNINEIIT